MRVPDEFATVKLAKFTTASLDKIDNGAAENYRVAAAAATLAPAVAEESRDPERKEADPDSRRSHEIVESIFTGVNICNIICGVVII